MKIKMNLSYMLQIVGETPHYNNIERFHSSKITTIYFYELKWKEKSMRTHYVR